MTGLATYCGSPTVGWVCIRNPGAALTSTMPPPASRTGSVMSTAMKSMPATSRPMTRAASSAISTLSGWASIVRSMELPPVDMFAVRVIFTIAPRRRDVVAAAALARRAARRGLVQDDAGEDLLVADAAARIGVGDVDELPDGVGAVADDVRRDPLGDRDHVTADDQEPVVAADEVALHHDPAAAGLALGHGERPGDRLLVAQVEDHAAAVVAVQRLDDDGEADALARPRARPRGCAPPWTAAPAGRRRPAAAASSPCRRRGRPRASWSARSSWRGCAWRGCPGRAGRGRRC